MSENPAKRLTEYFLFLWCANLPLKPPTERLAGGSTKKRRLLRRRSVPPLCKDQFA
jgi:hypothetical protein